jgi:hypothetical protein
MIYSIYDCYLYIYVYVYVYLYVYVYVYVYIHIPGKIRHCFCSDHQYKKNNSLLLS